jgi:hypothetical protein
MGGQKNAERIERKESKRETHRPAAANGGVSRLVGALPVG